VVAVSGIDKAFFALGFDSIDLHGLANPLFARPEASGIEFCGHPSLWPYSWRTSACMALI